MAAAILLTAPIRPALAPLPPDWAETAFLPEIEILIFPSGALFTGDRMGVDASIDADPEGNLLQLRVNSPVQLPIAQTAFLFNANSGDWRIQLPWVWDTTGRAGWNTLFANLSGKEGAPIPAGTAPLQYPVQVLPAARPNAVWRRVTGGCCVYDYLSGTESERDIDMLTAQTEAIYRELDAWMGGRTPGLTLFFLPRMYGQGGLAREGGILSYMDRNYSGTDFPVVLKHEMTHLFTAAFIPPGLWPPLVLKEGWAVYTTGGHYRSGEPLQDRAAAILQMGKYKPLADLADSFYSAQHELAYIEAGAFVEYLAGRFGRDRVFAMLCDPSNGSPAAALDSMLRKHFQLSQKESESAWLDSLRLRTPDPGQVRDVEFTLQMFDTLRRYQRLFDPGGFMFDLWLPDLIRARAERITADYLPGPATAESIALQVMLIAARKSAGEGGWAAARETLAAVERVLDAKERRVPDPCSVSPLAQRYRLLVSAIRKAGSEPLSIDLTGGQAEAETRDPDTLEKEVQRWDFVNGNWARAG